MPVYIASMDAVEKKVAEVEAAGEQIVSAFAANESACVIFTSVPRRPGRPRKNAIQVETR